MRTDPENSYEFNQFIKSYNDSLKTLVADNSASSVNSNIEIQRKIELLEFRIKYEKNIIKKKELEKELLNLKTKR